jgi:hypothetical protein
MVPKVVTSKAALLARVDMADKLLSQVEEATLLTLSKVCNDLVYSDGHTLSNLYRLPTTGLPAGLSDSARNRLPAGRLPNRRLRRRRLLTYVSLPS